MALLAHPAFAAGEVDTHFVDAHLDELLPQPASLPDVALIAAALGDFMRVDVQTRSAPTTAQSDGDLYSPWSVADGFRPGGR